MVRAPWYIVRPAGAYAPGRLTWGPVAQPIRRLPISIYRPVQGIPLQPSNVQAIVSGGTGGGGGGGFATPLLVQSASGSATAGTSVTVTLGTATTAHNCLVVSVGTVQTFTPPSVTGITLGGSADNFARSIAAPGSGCRCEIWSDQNCAGGQTSVVTSFSGGSGSFGFAVTMEEWSGIAAAGALDKTNVGSGTTVSSWSSSSTGALSQAAELVIGAVASTGGSGVTVTGPSSPWANLAQVNAGTVTALLSGYQAVTSAASQVYNGTFSGNENYAAAIASFKAAATGGGGGGGGGGGTTAGLAQVQLGPAGLGNIWYPAQVTLSTTTGITTGLDTSVANLYLGPAVTNTTLLGTVYGGNGIVAAALPNIQPGLFLIAQWTGANPGDVASMTVSGVMDAFG